MPVEPTPIEGLLLVEFDTHVDDRGFFRQTYQQSELAAVLGRPAQFVQGNHSRSAPGVLRGFHAEPWDKLIYVARGTAMAAVADLRPDSVTFGEVETFLLGDPPGERWRLFISAGLGNAFCALGTQPVDYVYDVSQEWCPDVDKGAVRWDDPDLAVPWPLPDPWLSPEDRDAPTLRERFPHHSRWR